MRDKRVEFERVEAGWLILEWPGDLKEINSITELDVYEYNLAKVATATRIAPQSFAEFVPKNKEEAELLVLTTLASLQSMLDTQEAQSNSNDIS